MTVYIEYAIIEGMIIDFTLIYVSLKVVRRRVIWPLALLSAAVGTGAAILLPLLHLGAGIKIALKILLGALMCVIASPKRPLPVCVAFFICSFALGGGIMALFSLPFAAQGEDGSYTIFSLPAGLVIAAAVGGGAAVSFCAKRLYARTKILRSAFDCAITNGKCTVRTRALADSGNNLFYRGQPVSVASAAIATELICASSVPVKIFETDVSTVTGKSRLRLIKVDSILLKLPEGERVFSGAYIAVSQNLKAGEYGVVLHCSYIK